MEISGGAEAAEQNLGELFKPFSTNENFLSRVILFTTSLVQVKYNKKKKNKVQKNYSDAFYFSRQFINNWI